MGGRGHGGAEPVGVVGPGPGSFWMPRSRVDRARQEDWKRGAPRLLFLLRPRRSRSGASTPRGSAERTEVAGPWDGAQANGALAFWATSHVFVEGT